jgi:hypothetical protein
MSDRRHQLIQEEDAGWADLHAALLGVGEERLLEPGVNEQWSAKDLLAHLGCWMAEAANVLERIRLGTYVDERLDVDAMNARFYEAMKDQSLRDVWAEMESARTRMFQEWAALPDVTGKAEEWFVESGPGHIAEHLPELRTFLGNQA